MRQKNDYVFDVISIGDAMLDIFLDVREAGVLYNVTEDTSLMCLSYADTIPVSSVSQSVAGNAANNAIGSSRLRLKTALYTELGDDDTSRKVIHTLQKEKIAVNYVKALPKTATNYTVVINYETERTQLTYRGKRNYRLPSLDRSKWIYLTAMGHIEEKFYASLIRYLVENGTKLGVNPGVEQIRDGLEVIKELLKVTSVLILNKEETRTLFNLKSVKGTDEITEMKEFLMKAWEYGPEIMVITNGGHGAYAYDGKKYWHIPVRKVKIIERTGAGDAFATGLIAGLFYGRPISEALAWGSFNGASVIGQIGPQAGLLTLYQMRRLLEKNKSYRAVEI